MQQNENNDNDQNICTSELWDLYLFAKGYNKLIKENLFVNNGVDAIITFIANAENYQNTLDELGKPDASLSEKKLAEINGKVAVFSIAASIVDFWSNFNPKLKPYAKALNVNVALLAGKAALINHRYKQGADKIISNAFAAFAAGLSIAGSEGAASAFNIISIALDKCAYLLIEPMIDVIEWAANKIEGLQENLIDVFEWKDKKITGIKKTLNDSINEKLNLLKNNKLLKELVVDDMLVLNDALIDSLQVRNKDLLQIFKAYNGEQPLVLGSITLDTFQGGIIKGNTTDSFAYRYALLHLNQFTIPGEYFYTKEFLGEEYDYLMQADKDNPATHSGMTEEYLKYRVAMLSTMKHGDSTGENERTTFVDKASNIEWINSPIPFDSKRVVFGSNSDDKGENGGLKGSPKDNDALFGAAGDDELESGDGSDYMEGGVGYDSYILSSKDKGVDTIFDIDGKGVLEVDGQKLNNLEFKTLDIPDSSKVFYTEDKHYSFTESDNNEWLFAARDDKSGAYKTLARIRDWKEGELGIKIDRKGKSTPPDKSFFKPHHQDKNMVYIYDGREASHGLKIYGSDYKISQFKGGDYDDIFYTGDATLHAVDAGKGNDYIRGGKGREYIIAGEDGANLSNDDDIVYGGADTDVILGGGGNDILWADDGTDNYEKPINTEQQGDWINGQHGSDTIYGSNKDDILLGGAGNDVVRGGGGKDLILGDADHIKSGNYIQSIAYPNYYQMTWIGEAEKGKLTTHATLENPRYLTFAWKWDVAKDDFKINFTKPGSKFDKEMRVQGIGDDTLYGGAGDDWIAGQAGNDVIYGGDDNDTLYGDDAVPLPKGFVDGDDTLYAGKGKDKLYGNGGNDTLFASDDDNDEDLLYGGDGEDKLYGGTGHDKLYGGKNNDWLYAGNDGSEMDGGEDNDTYISYVGDDHMTDESGDDTYLLSSGTDIIVDKSGDDIYQTGSGRMASAGTTTIQDHDGKGKIMFNGSQLTNNSILATAENEWRTIDGRVALTKRGNDLVMRSAMPNSQGQVIFTDFFSKDEFLSLKLSAYHNPQPPEANNPPQVGTAIPAQTVNEKSQLQFTLPADAFNDPDNDDLRYTATLSNGDMLPRWLHFDAAKHTFSGTPGNDDVGNLSIRVTAHDGKGGSAAQDFSLEVVNVNDAPQIGTTLANQERKGGEPWQYRLPADAFHDIDKDDTLTLSATLENGQSLPAWLKFDAETGQFTGTPQDTARTYRIVVTATDQAGAQVEQSFNLTVTAGANQPPIINAAIPAQKTNEKDEWRFTLPEDAFSDPDGDPLTYTATLADGNALPEWLHFDAEKRIFSGMPGNDDVGNLSIRVTATDGRGGSAAQNIALEVVNVNDAPQIGVPLANQQGTGGKPWQYRLPSDAFRDIDKGDVLTLSAKLDDGQPLPSWLAFDAATGQFSGTPPSSEQAGTYRIAVTATDKAGAQAKQAFNLDITPPANIAPQVATIIAAQKANEKSHWQFTLPADAFSDPDGDPLAYTATLADGKALPEWLHFDAEKRIFSGTPGNDDVGNLSIRVTATDGRGGSATQNFALEVVNVNDAPQIGTTLANQQGTGGKPWQYRLPANAFRDIDKGDVLTLSAKLDNGQPLPSWLKFDGKTGQFSATLPKEAKASAYRIAVTATDKAGAQAKQAFNLDITPPANTAPQAATTIVAQKVNEKSRWQFTLPANAFRDPDGDTLTYTASLVDGKALPKWLHFDAAKRTFSGTPGNDDVGNLSIRVTATDGRGGSATQNFALEVVNVNDAPQIGTELKGQTIIGGELWQYRLPIDAFKDIDKDDVLTLSVRLGDSSGGGNLPTWLTFDAKTGLFKGTPSNENQICQIKVTATDKFGANVSQEFPLQVAEKKSYLYGSEKDDKIFGAGGNEHIYGYGGNDILWGKAGNDTIYAGSGDDVVNGEDGNDRLFGDAGNDRLIGGNGNDRLGGGQGDDILDGGSGNDYLYGDEGNDIYRFMGNYGHDSINNSFGSKGEVDVIEFPDRRLQDVIITRNEDHLIIKDLYYNNQITVIKHFQKDSHYYIHRIRFADGSTLDYDAVNRLVQQPTGNPPRANLVQDRYAADAARQAQVLTQAMAASGAQPLDNLMTPDNPPLVPPLLSNLKP